MNDGVNYVKRVDLFCTEYIGNINLFLIDAFKTTILLRSGQYRNTNQATHYIFVDYNDSKSDFIVLYTAFEDRNDV